MNAVVHNQAHHQGSLASMPLARPYAGEITEPEPRLPDFVIVGAAKSGTTSLHAALSQTPGVFMCNPKEPEFFGRDELYSRGLDWYSNLFKDAKPTDICGEASTIYSRRPVWGAEAVERMARAIPDARLIYIVREPVRRVYSDYCQLISNRLRVGGDRVRSMTFAEAIEQQPHIVSASQYGDQLQHLLRYYPRERILVLDFQRLQSEPDALLQDVLDFLGVDARADELDRCNTSNAQFHTIVRERMLDRFRGGPIHRARHLVPRPIRVKLYDWLATSTLSRSTRSELMPSEMDVESCKRLARELRPDIELFERTTGFDASAWYRNWEAEGWT